MAGPCSAACQTLKTRGVGLIEDDSLRIGVTAFYETSNVMLKLEFVAAVGVMLSLLFVGFNIRQDSQVARGQARQDLAALNQTMGMQWRSMLRKEGEVFHCTNLH